MQNPYLPVQRIFRTKQLTTQKTKQLNTQPTKQPTNQLEKQSQRLAASSAPLYNVALVPRGCRSHQG